MIEEKSKRVCESSAELKIVNCALGAVSVDQMVCACDMVMTLQTIA